MKNALKNIDSLIDSNGETFDKSINHKIIRFRTDDVVIKFIGDDIELDFKGTEKYIKEWFFNFWTSRREWLSMGCVERGFSYNAEEMAGGEHQPDSLVNMCLAVTGSITMRGHSRGGVLAPLIATILVWHGVDPKRMSIYLFAAPRLGNKKFKKEYNKILGDRTFVLNGTHDWVTYVPTWSQRIGIVEKFKGGRLHSLLNYRRSIIKNIERVLIFRNK